MLHQGKWSGEEFIIADIRRKRVGDRLIMFSLNEQIDLLLNSTTWFYDGTFKTVPLIFDQVYIIQCLVGDESKLKQKNLAAYYDLILFILVLPTV